MKKLTVFLVTGAIALANIATATPSSARDNWQNPGCKLDRNGFPNWKCTAPSMKNFRRNQAVKWGLADEQPLEAVGARGDGSQEPNTANINAVPDVDDILQRFAQEPAPRVLTPEQLKMAQVMKLDPEKLKIATAEELAVLEKTYQDFLASQQNCPCEPVVVVPVNPALNDG